MFVLAPIFDLASISVPDFVSDLSFVSGNGIVFLVFVTIAAAYTVAVTAIPAVICLVEAERHRITDLSSYAIAGAIIGIIALIVFAIGQMARGTIGNIAFFAALGASAAIVYWFVAVRGQPRFDDSTQADDEDPVIGR